MKFLGLIPARGGSVRVPRKNIADLAGKPLLAWTIEEAQRCDALHALAVSTEDKEIAACAQRYNCNVIERPYHLATDASPMLPVVSHALSYVSADVVVLLQPTSPFRRADDIYRAIGMFKEAGADAVVSMTEPPDDMVFELGHAGRMRPKTNIIVPNGAIYIISKDALLRGHNWYSGITYAYEMPRDRSLDIDTQLDLRIARAIAQDYEAA